MPTASNPIAGALRSRFFTIFFSFFFAFFFLQAAVAEEKPYVIGKLISQLGNNLFQVAAASAVAWDNGAEPLFPDFDLVQYPWLEKHYSHVFFRCSNKHPEHPIEFYWQEPSFAYHPISFHSNMMTTGYFQSEKYFVQHRERILELFAPRKDDATYIQNKYGALLDSSLTVAVQIRLYWEDAEGNSYNQYGKDYFTKAMDLFPADTLFIVSSNNLEFAKRCLPESHNIFYLQDEPDYIDLFILSRCKHAIISNSSFGWWAAWLIQNPEKKVVCPAVWVNPKWPLPTQDVCPDEWIKLEARYGKSSDPETCD